MSWFGQIELILRKDARALRWPLVVFALVVLLRALADVTYQPGDHDSVAPFLLRALYYFSWAVVAGLLVHQEPLLGVTTYWKTRPIRPMALLAAKAALAFVSLALIPGLVDVAVLARYGLDAAEWPATLLRSVSEQTAWLAAAGALAAVTWSVPTYLLGIAVAAVVWAAGVLTVERYLGPRGFDYMFLPVVIAGGSAFVLWRQYRRRRPSVSVAVLSALYFLSPIVSGLPVNRLTTRMMWEARPLPAEILTVETHSDRRPKVSVRVGLAEVSDGQFFNGDRVYATLGLRDGTSLRAEAQASTFASRHNERAALASALPDHAWFGIRAGSTDVNTVVALRPIKEVEPGTLSKLAKIDGVAQVEKYAFQRVGVVPARAGAELVGGSLSFRIEEISEDDLHVRVEIRGSRVESPGYPPVFVLVEPQAKLASRDDLFLDSHNFMVEVLRAGRRVAWFGGKLSFLLPRERRSPDLSSLELQVWRPVLQRRYAGIIEIQR